MILFDRKKLMPIRTMGQSPEEDRRRKGVVRSHKPNRTDHFGTAKRLRMNKIARKSRRFNLRRG